MHRAVLIAAMCGVFFFSCETTSPEPTKQTPRTACAISCKQGWMFRPQHMCRGSRYFQDILITGRHTTRGADGTVLSDTWAAVQGDFAVQDVELGTCSTVIARIIASRDVSERGQHPGEDNQGRPEPPK